MVRIWNGVGSEVMGKKMNEKKMNEMQKLISRSHFFYKELGLERLQKPYTFFQKGTEPYQF